MRRICVLLLLMALAVLAMPADRGMAGVMPLAGHADCSPCPDNGPAHAGCPDMTLCAVYLPAQSLDFRSDHPVASNLQRFETQLPAAVEPRLELPPPRL